MGAVTDQKLEGSALEILARCINIVQQWCYDTESGMSK